jgi:flagellar hook-length control protein FliK
MSVTDQIAPTNLPGTGSAGGFFASLGGHPTRDSVGSTLAADFQGAIDAVNSVTDVPELLAAANSLYSDTAQVPTVNFLGDVAQADLKTASDLSVSLPDTSDIQDIPSLDNNVFADLSFSVSGVSLSEENTVAPNLSLNFEQELLSPLQVTDAESTASHILPPEALEKFEQLAASLKTEPAYTSAPVSAGAPAPSVLPSGAISPDTSPLTSDDLRALSTATSDPVTVDGFLDLVKKLGVGDVLSGDSAAQTGTSDSASAETAIAATSAKGTNPAVDTTANSDINNNIDLAAVDFDSAIEEAKLAAVSSPVTANPANISESISTVTAQAGTVAAGPQAQPQIQQNSDSGLDPIKQSGANQINNQTSANENQTNADTDGEPQGQASNQGHTQSLRPSQSQAGLESNQAFDTALKSQSTQSQDNLSQAAQAQTQTASAPKDTTPVAQTATTPQTTAPLLSDSLAPLTYERFLNNNLQSSFGSLLGKDDGLFNSGELFGGRPSSALASQIKNQFNLAISRAATNGEQEFTVRLNPGDLGRVNVRLQFAENGGLRAQVAVENPETLELLQRDAKGFERALEANGHKTEQNGISFSLENNNQESAGRALAEALQQEKIRDELASRPDSFTAQFDDGLTNANEAEVPLEDILPYVSVDTGLDIRI